MGVASILKMTINHMKFKNACFDTQKKKTRSIKNEEATASFYSILAMPLLYAG